MAIIQYPGTNFHDLNLDWVLEQVKNLLTEWGETRTDWENLLADNTEFKSTLENEWDNFHDYILAHVDEDVPTEVVAEIDRMASDGRLLGIITADPTGEGSALSDAVGGWISTHLHPEPTDVMIDDSLSVQGAAADAKATGDAIADLKNALNAFAESATITHNETVTVGPNQFNFSTPIPSNVPITIKNTTETQTQFTVIFVKMDDSYDITGDVIIPGDSITYTKNFPIKGLRGYVNSTDWSFEIKYGEGISENAVRYDKAQTKTSTEKQTARTNIDAASQSEFSTVQSAVAQLQSDVMIDNVHNIYNTSTLVNGYINYADGVITSLTNAKTSELIPVNEGEIITYSLHAIGGVAAVIACYDNNETYLQNKSVQATGSAGSWVVNEGTFTLPSGVDFIRYETKNTEYNNDSITLTAQTKIKDYLETEIPGNSWNGKAWAAFGTSITDTEYQDAHFLQPTGKYVPFLVEMSGMTVHNYGIAGASIMPNIKDKVLSTNIENEEIITVEGSVNDHATSKPLGSVGDKTADTFAGCIYLIAKYVYENSNATLFFITDYVGRYVHINPAPDGSDFYGDCAPGKVNTLGLKQIDYINMMKAQCEYFSIPCIDAGQKCSINELTGNLYLMDHIHSSYVGGKQYAQTIWDELKLANPRLLTV